MLGTDQRRPVTGTTKSGCVGAKDIGGPERHPSGDEEEAQWLSGERPEGGNDLPAPLDERWRVSEEERDIRSHISRNLQQLLFGEIKAEQLDRATKRRSSIAGPTPESCGNGKSLLKHQVNGRNGAHPPKRGKRSRAEILPIKLKWNSCQPNHIGAICSRAHIQPITHFTLRDNGVQIVIAIISVSNHCKR